MLADRLRMTTKVALAGQQAYTTAGTYTFTVPAGVTSISVLCVGSGGGSAQQRGGVGGSLAYKNNISVTAGTSITVVVGYGGSGTNSTQSLQVGNPSYISGGGLGTPVYAKGGGEAGTNTGDASYNGGSEGSWSDSGGGGGGAAGYSGTGGVGGDGGYSNGTAGASGSGGGGGGGGGGAYTADYFSPGVGQYFGGGGGGGVGILGTGSSGSGGTGAVGGTGTAGGGGGGGSSGSNGSGASGNAGPGGAYGGGAGGVGFNENNSTLGTPASGGVGAVRIIWGAGRSYPSNAANV